MKRSQADVAKTRADVLDAALTEFSRQGVALTTIGDIAQTAGVTRGAVYWHFKDKSALVHELMDGLEWPLDIGGDDGLYQSHHDPLQLLSEELWTRVEACMADGNQWRIVRLLLRHGGDLSLPTTAAQKLTAATSRSVERIAKALNIAFAHRGLRPGLTVLEVAHCAHAFGLGILCEYLEIPTRSGHRYSRANLEMLFKGACDPAKAY